MAKLFRGLLRFIYVVSHTEGQSCFRADFFYAPSFLSATFPFSSRKT